MRDEYASYYSRRDELSSQTYNLIIGGILLWGFVINALMCAFCTDFFMELNRIAIIIVYFVVAIVGILMSKNSDIPFISFIGYNLVVLPVGMVLSICLTEYDKVSILNISIATAVVTLIMTGVSVIIPDVFLSMGKTLFICLCAVVIIEGLCIIFGIYMPTIWDMLVAVLFCGYIGYDWANAQQKIKTLDNAIDTCTELYLDIINLFLRILSVSGKRKSSK